MAKSRKPAIERTQGIDDIITPIAKMVFQKYANASAAKGAKAFKKMQKTAEKAGGSITKSIDPKQSTPKKLTKQWDKQHKKFTKGYDKFNKYNTKARSNKNGR